MIRCSRALSCSIALVLLTLLGSAPLHALVVPRAVTEAQAPLTVSLRRLSTLSVDNGKLFLDANTAYVWSGEVLKSYDLTQAAMPREAGAWNVGQLEILLVKGGRLYARVGQQFRIYSLAAASLLRLLGQASPIYFGAVVAINGQRLVYEIRDKWGGPWVQLAVLDISDPAQLDDYGAGSCCRRDVTVPAFLDRTTLYAGGAYLDGRPYLEIVDLTDAQTPSLLGLLEEGPVVPMYAANDVLYATILQTLVRYDVSDPVNIRRIADTEPQRMPSGTFVAGGLAYVESGLALEVYDARNGLPVSALPIASLEQSGSVAASEGNLLLLTEHLPNDGLKQALHVIELGVFDPARAIFVPQATTGRK